MMIAPPRAVLPNIEPLNEADAELMRLYGAWRDGLSGTVASPALGNPRRVSTAPRAFFLCQLPFLDM
jgi:hypothetical protein